MADRVTQVTGEVVAEGDQKARVTQVTGDVIAEGDQKARVTQVTGAVIAEGPQNARVTQASIDVISDGEFVSRITQFTVDVIADVVAHTPSIHLTQLSIEVIAEQAVEIITTSPLLSAFAGDAYSAFIIATGGLGALTYAVTASPGYATTSSTSFAISPVGTTLAFTVGTGLSYVPGQRIKIVFDGSNYMHATVISYSSGTGAMVVEVTFTFGSGTHSSWVVDLTPPAGFSLNSATGEITGPFTEIGTFTFDITVSDAHGHSATTTYTLTVEDLDDLIAAETENVNLGIGVFGLGYTIDRGLSGVEAHFEMCDVGLGTSGGGSSLYLRSATNFPRDLFPVDQLFYLEIIGSNVGSTPVTWTVIKGDSSYSQDIIQPVGQFGRLRNAVPFEGPNGGYLVRVTAASALNAAVATAVRIVAPLRRNQAFVSEVRMTNANFSSNSDQTIGGPDLFRTSSSGHDGFDDGWVSTGQPVFKFESAAWQRINYATLYIVMANASFEDQVAYKFSEIAFVDIDDFTEFKFNRKISTQNQVVFLTPTQFGLGINPTTLRDGHRYQIYARSVKRDGNFTFNTYLHTVRLQLALDPGNVAEIYNRCGMSKRTYLPGFATPNPEIYYQVESGIAEANVLSHLGSSTPAGNSTTGPGTTVPAANITSVPNDSARTGELSAYLVAGRDYQGSPSSGELVYRFTNVIRRRTYNYMF